MLEAQTLEHQTDWRNLAAEMANGLRFDREATEL